MRSLEVVRLVYGAAQFAFPRTVTHLTAAPEERGIIVASRLLGARDIVQALATMNASRRRSRFGGVVDALHAVSAIAFAALHPSSRRQALVSAAVAAAFSAGKLL